MAKYDWGDGKGAVHTIPIARHVQNVNYQNPNSPNLGQIAAGQAPAAPAGPAPTPQPFDPAAEGQRLTANRNNAIGAGESAYQAGNLSFDAGYNPDGSINASNPYSRAAMLQLGYENRQRGTTNSMAARGQLYAGSYLNQQGIDASNYAKNEHANRLSYQRGMHGIQAGRLSSMATNATGVGDADFNALLKATYPTGT